MDGMTIRLATLEDREEVLAIRDDIYDGIDYLAAFYDHLVTCSNTKPYVGVVDGKIIAFVVAFIVDEGSTVVSRAGRISSVYEGKGLFYAFQGHALRQPGASEHAFTAIESPELISKRNHHGFKLASSRELYRYHCDTHSQSSNTTLPTCEGSEARPRTATIADLELYMTLDKHRKYLFPDDVIIVNWVPYRLFPSNVPLIGVPGHTNMLTNVETGNQKGILSIATFYPTKDPEFTANLDIYGSDIDSLLPHIAAQIEFIRTHVGKQSTLCLQVLADACLLESVVENAFAKFDIQRDKLIFEGDGIKCPRQLLIRKCFKP